MRKQSYLCEKAIIFVRENYFRPLTVSDTSKLYPWREIRSSSQTRPTRTSNVVIVSFVILYLFVCLFVCVFVCLFIFLPLEHLCIVIAFLVTVCCPQLYWEFWSNSDQLLCQFSVGLSGFHIKICLLYILQKNLLYKKKTILSYIFCKIISPVYFARDLAMEKCWLNDRSLFMWELLRLSLPPLTFNSTRALSFWYWKHEKGKY